MDCCMKTPLELFITVITKKKILWGMVANAEVAGTCE